MVITKHFYCLLSIKNQYYVIYFTLHYWSYFSIFFQELEALRAEKNARGFPQLFPSAKESVLHEKETKPSFPTETELSSGMVTDSFRDWSKKTGSDQPIEEITADPTDTDTDTHFQKDYARRRDPMMLPVTIESKTGSKHKTDDPLKVYGFPKELLPIMPGGGSRFEDVEREKLEKEKMSQTKGTGDDSVESGSSHESEGRYSSASLSSLSLCFYWLVSFHRLDRILLL